MSGRPCLSKSFPLGLCACLRIWQRRRRFFPSSLPGLRRRNGREARENDVAVASKLYFPFRSPVAFDLEMLREGRRGTDDFAFSKVPEGESNSGGDVSQTFLKSSLPFFSLRLPPPPPLPHLYMRRRGRKEIGGRRRKKPINFIGEGKGRKRGGAKVNFRRRHPGIKRRLVPRSHLE